MSAAIECVAVETSTHPPKRQDRRGIRRTGLKLSREDIRAVAKEMGLPAFLTTTQAARLVGLSATTIARDARRGRYPNAVIPGKPMRLWTEGFIADFAARWEVD